MQPAVIWTIGHSTRPLDEFIGLLRGERIEFLADVRPGDVIAVKAGTTAEPVIRDATELTGQIPAWLQADHDGLTAKMLRKPERKEIAAPVQEQLIVELYSK